MSEQAPPQEETPTTPAPEGTPGPEQQAAEQAAVNYEQRYNELRPEFDRKSQRLSELEQREQWFDLLTTSDDPDTRRRAAQALGYEIADEEPDEPQDPNEALLARLAAMEQRMEQQSQEAQNAAQIAQIEQYVEAQLDALPGNLDEKTRRRIVNDAVAMPATPDGMPDIQTAFREFQEWEVERQKAWRETKRAHPISPVGEEGTQQHDLTTHEGRVAHVLGRMAAEEQ